MKKASAENPRIVKAALRLAAKGWAHVTIDAVAREAKIPATKLKQRFALPSDIAALIVAETSHEAVIAAGKPTGPAHDILFDLLMTRFDILQKIRSAILNISDAARRDCGLSRILAKAALNSAYAFADASKITAPPRHVLALGIAAIHGWAFIVWRKDESHDMAKTMAALDRALRLAGKTAEFLTRNS